MTDDRYALARRIATRLCDHPRIEARPWAGTELGTVRVYVHEVEPGGIRARHRGAVALHQHESGDAWADDCSEGWDDPGLGAHVGAVARALCAAWNLKLRRTA